MPFHPRSSTRYLTVATAIYRQAQLGAHKIKETGVGTHAKHGRVPGKNEYTAGWGESDLDE